MEVSFKAKSTVPEPGALNLLAVEAHARSGPSGGTICAGIPVRAGSATTQTGTVSAGIFGDESSKPGEPMASAIAYLADRKHHRHFHQDADHGRQCGA